MIDFIYIGGGSRNFGGVLVILPRKTPRHVFILGMVGGYIYDASAEGDLRSGR